MLRSKLCLLLLLIFITSCAGKFQYVPPSTSPCVKNSIVINMSKDEFWKKAIPALAKSFFVINNLDKDSGIINISYSGDPEEYVDCGQITSYVRNGQGERFYSFPGSKSRQMYEIMDMKHGATLSFIDRRMDLEGRINIVVEEVSSNRCRVTVNIKYVLTKSGVVRSAGGFRNFSDTISFVSGHKGVFPQGLVCQPTGKLEEEILSVLIQSTKK